ncbi:MAG: hypothetical protein KC445_17510 [Anaerolineales bacterium]|nr:hypothetical protein [Anaerolineales bacterium]
MRTNGANSNRHLLKMKVALAAGGLITTFIGAGLLGSQAAETAVTTTTTTNTSPSLNETVTNTTITLPELDLELEAIPTVAAPSFSVSSRPVANGRSSG